MQDALGSATPRQKFPCTVGLCCMANKSSSKQMRELLARFATFPELRVIVFEERVILNAPVTEWPKCDCLIAFFSKGFPLEKAIAYADLHPKMFCVNDLYNQQFLRDRSWVYEALRRNNMPIVNFAIMSRGGHQGNKEPKFLETDEYVEVDGKRIYKPLVEKPLDAEDHNIHIYFDTSRGGGCVKLFRKVAEKSSERAPDLNDVRTDSSYIYEEYLETDGLQDLKVYVVGQDYQYAELRKSPVKDGHVERDEKGKEIRQLGELSQYEREVAQKIVQVFGQRVCGFDILRSKGRSYVCDVNGWSFVKGSPKYYDQAASILRGMFQEAVVKKGLAYVDVPVGVRTLRGVICLMRHADRTPKQKVKLKTTNSAILLLLNPEKVDKQVVFKSNSQGKTMLERLNSLLEELGEQPAGVAESDRDKLKLLHTVLTQQYEGLKVQIKPTKIERGRAVQATLVCKWGGWLTAEGTHQARHLGATFPAHVSPLNKSLAKPEFTAEVAIVTNSERRVMKTGLEFVRKLTGRHYTEEGLEVSNRLLGDTGDAKDEIEAQKSRIKQFMHDDSPEGTSFAGIRAIRRQTGGTIAAMARAAEQMDRLLQFIPKNAPLHGGETALMMKQRWRKLRADFYNEKTGTYDTTKIPDIFDYIAYDSMYNQAQLGGFDMFPLFHLAQVMAGFVVHGEYGLEPSNKQLIGALIALPLLHRIQEDLHDIAYGNATARTRLFFSSESHLQAFRNMLLHSGVTEFHQLPELVPLHYMTHIVLKLYESANPSSEDDRFHMEVHFSSGIDINPFGIVDGHHIESITPMILIHNDFRFSHVSQIVEKATAQVEEYKKRHPHQQQSPVVEPGTPAVKPPPLVKGFEEDPFTPPFADSCPTEVEETTEDSARIL
eukprot:TRINITY_DN4830_c0_g1_i1.p1 TRINITY_DN4830_c0_g1~~TRINITY_DN4830_c0_g1_i1.p1  ORF type:complete len:885 (-),score=150.95 TRINITY_DN4830_c0_g1_i1:99-2753(-)